MSLHRARTAASADRWNDVLTDLLDAWRAQRAPELADCIDQVSAWLALSQEPIRGSRAQLEARWLEVETRRDPADLERLLNALPQASINQATAWLDRLQDWPADPRFSRAFCAWIAQPPWSSSRARRIYVRALRHVHQTGDQRAVLALHQTLPHLDQVWASSMRDWMARRVPSTIERIERALPRVIPRLSPADADIVRSLMADIDQAWSDWRTGRRHETGLLDQVLADPSEDEARLVYADVLSERGDPRGEFIVLQLLDDAGASSPEQQARMERLRVRHEREWLGDLARAIVIKDLVWKRGFPWVCSVRATRFAEIQPLVGDPTWSTIHDLWVRGDLGYRPIEIALHPVMRSLRILRGVRSIDLLQATCTGGPELPIEVLDCTRRDADWAAGAFHRFDKPMRSTRLPGLRKLIVDNDFVSALPWFADGAPAQTVREVEGFVTGRPDLQQWVDALRQARWERVVLRLRHTVIEMTDRRVHIETTQPDTGPALASVLGYLDPRGIDEIEVLAPALTHDDLARVLVRFRHAELWDYETR